MTSLAHDVVRGARADDARTAVFAHGILGSRSNWKGFARRLVELAPAWTCVLVDLRGHGDSHGLPPPHTVERCADDVQRLVDGLALPCTLAVGHSFGGKVVAAWAARGGMDEVWVLDAPFGARPALLHGDEEREEVARVLSVVRGLPMPIASRRDLVAALSERGLSPAIAAWMTTNLRPVDGGFAWRFDLGVVDELLRSFAALDLWPAVEQQITARVVTVRGGRSDRFSDEERARLASAVDAGLVEDHVLPGAGHWVHTDDPDGLLALLRPALERPR